MAGFNPLLQLLAMGGGEEQSEEQSDGQSESSVSVGECAWQKWDPYVTLAKTAGPYGINRYKETFPMV